MSGDRGGDFIRPLADLIHEQARDEEARRLRRQVRRMWVAFSILYLAATTVLYSAIVAAAR